MLRAQVQPVGCAMCIGRSSTVMPLRMKHPARRIPTHRLPASRAIPANVACSSRGGLHTKKALGPRSLRIRQHHHACSSCTTQRAGVAAAWRRIDLNLMNDLGQTGTVMRVFRPSSMRVCGACGMRCYLSNPTRPVSASPSIAGGGGVQLPGGGPSGSAPYGAWEGVPSPPGLELGPLPPHPATIPAPPARTHSGLRTSQVPLRRSRAPPMTSARWPTFLGSLPPPPAPAPTSPPPAEAPSERCARSTGTPAACARAAAKHGHRRGSCRDPAPASRLCRARLTQPRSPCLRRSRCRGAVATARRQVPHGRTGAVREGRYGRSRPPHARAGRWRGRRREYQRGCRPWTARDGGGHLWGGAEAASPPSRPRTVPRASRRREIGAVCSPDRLRGGSGRAGPGQTVVRGHVGGGRRARGASRRLWGAPARAHTWWSIWGENRDIREICTSVCGCNSALSSCWYASWR